MSTDYDALHRQVNEYYKALPDVPGVDKISQTMREFGLKRSDVREFIGISDLLDFSDADD